MLPRADRDMAECGDGGGRREGSGFAGDAVRLDLVGVSGAAMLALRLRGAWCVSGV